MTPAKIVARDVRNAHALLARDPADDPCRETDACLCRTCMARKYPGATS